MRRIGVALVALTCVALSACGAVPPAAPGPAGPAWTPLPPAPLSARQGMVAAAVGDRFVLVGGTASTACPPNASCIAPPDGYLRDGAVFDPATGRWRAIADAPVPVSSYRVAVLGDALYLLDVPDPSVAEEVLLRYDLGDDAWTRLPSPPSRWSDLEVAGDRIVAIAGTDEFGDTADGVLSPETDTWTVLPDDPLGPSFDRGAAWIGDRLLLTAHDLVPNPGAERPSLTRMAVLDADLTSWTLLPDSPILGGNPIPVDGTVVFPDPGSADGGEVNGWERTYASGGIWDPATGEWSPLPAGGPGYPQEGEGLPALGALGDGTVLVSGTVLDPVAGTWSGLPASPLSTRFSPAVAVGDGMVLVWGGTAEGFRRNLADGALLRR